LLLITQTCLMLIALCLGMCTVAGLATVLLISAGAFLSGVVLSFDQPARAALVSTLVPKEDLLNAVALQSAVFNTASILGPAIAGLVVVQLGVAADFFLNALSFTGVLVALLRLPSSPRVTLKRDRLVRQVLDTLASLRNDQVLVLALAIYSAMLLAGPSQQLLIPVLADDRLHAGPAVLGILFSAGGTGAVLGAVLAGRFRQANVRWIQAAVMVWCGALVSVGTSTLLPVTFMSLVLLGAGQSVVGAATATLLQTRVRAEQRGRVMSVNTLLLMGVRPLGDFPLGVLMTQLGVPLTTLIGAGAVAVSAAWRILVHRGVDRSETVDSE
jgi:MFS family permease